MGITWRYNMVLLSTLAALVIIVHSQEELENQYRRGLRPRAVDTGTRRFEQPWRTLEVEPVMQESTSMPEEEDNSTEEPPRRRRPGRKRQRRPLPHSAEELDPGSNERFPDDIVRPHFVDFSKVRQTSEMPKKRRKKIKERLGWADSLEEDRPTRRRVHRRKQHLRGTRPELSEFSDYRPNEAFRIVDEEASNDQVMTINEDRHGDTFGSTPHFTQNQHEDILEPREEVFGLDDNTRSKSQEKDLNGFLQQAIYSVPIKEDKSLSEFSLEGLEAAGEQEGKKHEEKLEIMDPPQLIKEMNKSQVTGSFDPLTLKDILKKSNGTSLSEILQQHNLSLTDLLHGKQLALSILKSENSVKTSPEDTPGNKTQILISEEKESSEEKLLQHSETKYVTEPVAETTDYPTTTLLPHTDEDITTVEEMETTTTEKSKIESTTRPNISRYPANRRKQRIRPVINNNYKSQHNRDMMALTARKYFYNNSRRRNTTKSQVWKDIIPLMKKNLTTENEKQKVESTTFGVILEETTIYDEHMNTTLSLVENNKELNDTTNKALDEVNPENETQDTKAEDPPKPANELDKPRLVQSTTQMNTSGLRRQAFNNILKKKRRKHKFSSTEPPQVEDNFMKNLFGMPNLVSSSEFIARTQGPKASLDDVTIEDFITTEMPRESETKPRKNRYSNRSPATNRQIFTPSSTEESAKIEIEEILNDTRANARLSKILKERNMTLSELVEHRERGSSHVHLADIFHNASKEPNSPEPFLSKSAIEPISKETYPLRALLDANIHDTTAKATTIDSMHDDFIHIPMKMDFGNNVNENAENMGIMTLFNNITKADSIADATTVMKDSEGTPYSATVIVVNASDIHKEIDTVREGRVMQTENLDETVGWNDIFALMRRNYENKTKQNTYIDGLIPAESIRKPSSEDVLDEDGLIVLEDLQRLNDFSSKVASEEQLDGHTNERTEAAIEPGQTKSVTKSVTLATASIVGLAMVLFLLTFIGYRWWQQRSTAEKTFPDERIPTPVFENRKGHKNNSSTRSLSPMLSSNIYTLSTLDSQHGKESPDYMWDSLRKPFQ